MRPSYRPSELILTLVFLATLYSVPIVQTCMELGRKENVQFTDVFHMKPSAKNLRQYEHTLEDKSWFQQRLRPEVQYWFNAALGDTGSKAMVGIDGWLFYRPDVRYLLEPNRKEIDRSEALWVRPADGSTQRDSVVRAILHYQRALKQRGLELLVMPVPGKPAIYPDKLTRRIAGHAPDGFSPTASLLQRLGNEGIATVDLFAAFEQDRRASTSTNPADGDLYLARDTHWTPRGARLAALHVAERLRQLGWAPAAVKDYQVRKVLVQRLGDVIGMLQSSEPKPESLYQEVACDQVVDPDFGVMTPSGSDRPGAYKTPGQSASILVLGDSFSRIYQYPEPQSLGRITAAAAAAQAETATKRLLPGSAGFIAQLAAQLKSPVDAIVSDGGASTDVRKTLSTYPEMIEGKKVVIWEFVERDLALGREGWEDVDLPAKLN